LWGCGAGADAVRVAAVQVGGDLGEGVEGPVNGQGAEHAGSLPV